MPLAASIETQGCLARSQSEVFGGGKSGSAMAPSATAIRVGKRLERQNTVDPQVGQKKKSRTAPDSPWREKRVDEPCTSTASAG
jgi:hypothetical protein